MIGRNKTLVLSALLIGAASLGGCATKKYVNEQVAPVAARVAEQDTRLSGIEQTTREALQRAEAAGKLAEGKFVYSMVLSDDSLKFPAGKATLSPEAMARLDAFANKLKTENRNVFIEIQGHTDASGDKSGHYRMGEARAEAVRKYLNQQGVPLNRMSTISYGSDAPVAPNNTRDGRAANRRVVLIVLS